MRPLLFLFLLMPLSLLSLQAGEKYSVIINSKSPIKQLTPNQIRKIFLKEFHFLGKDKAIPVNLLSSNPGRIIFEENILKISRERIHRYWIKKHFLGISPPITQASFESAKIFIQSVQGAIGYIPTRMVDQNVKVLYEF